MTEYNSIEGRQASLGEKVNNSKNSPDPAVQKAWGFIREKVLSDRSLHGKVSLVASIIIYRVWCGLGFEISNIFSHLLLCAARGDVFVVRQGVF